MELHLKALLLVIRVNSRDPPCKDYNAWFTTVPLKPLPDPNVEDIVVFLGSKVLILMIQQIKCARNYHFCREIF